MTSHGVAPPGAFRWKIDIIPEAGAVRLFDVVPPGLKTRNFKKRKRGSARQAFSVPRLRFVRLFRIVSVTRRRRIDAARAGGF